MTHQKGPSSSNYSKQFDLLGIFQKFNLEMPTGEIKIIGTHGGYDHLFIKLIADKKIYYLYEVDYIQSLDYELGNIKKIIGSDFKLYTVKEQLRAPEDQLGETKWLKYVTNYSGSDPSFYKFLIGVNPTD